MRIQRLRSENLLPTAGDYARRFEGFVFKILEREVVLYIKKKKDRSRAKICRVSGHPKFGNNKRLIMGSRKCVR